MKHIMRIMAVAFACLLVTQVAWAQKASVVTKIEGAAYVVRSCATHNWVATWAQQGNGMYKLYVINGDDGNKQEVTTEKTPGGLCWIPYTNKLLFCTGIVNDKVDHTRVTYYLYDFETKKKSKKIDVNDMIDTYLLDPISSDDGIITFHMTIAATGRGDFPSFNIYNNNSDVMIPIPAEANMAADYDLSTDGSKVYWLLHDQETGNLFIVAWEINKQNYSDIYEYGAAIDPSDDHALLKVQSNRNRAITLASSETDPSLKLCVYDFNNIDSLYIMPVNLKSTEEVVHFDWKGFSDTIYALLNDTTTNEYLIEEINVLTGVRKNLLNTKDEISFLDYAAASKTYYYSVVDQRGSNDPVTSIIRFR